MLTPPGLLADAKTAVPGKRVLVIDDDPRILDGVARMLEGQEWETHVTDEPRGAVDQAKQLHPDVILLDVRMPGMDGYDVFEGLQKEPLTSAIPVVLITAKAITFRMPASYLRELAGVVNKPFSRTQLLEGLRLALKKGIRTETPPGA